MFGFFEETEEEEEEDGVEPNIVKVKTWKQHQLLEFLKAKLVDPETLESDKSETTDDNDTNEPDESVSEEKKVEL
eukprot:UN18505